MQNCWVFRRIELILCLVLLFVRLVAQDSYKLRNEYLEKKLEETSIFVSTEPSSPEDIIKNLTLFEFYLDKGEIILAEKFCSSLFLYHPIRQLVNYRLGEYYYKLGKFEQAKKYLHQCVSFDSQFHEARRLLASSLLELKEYKAAYRHYNVLSWFKPDREVINQVEYLSNYIGLNSTEIKEVTFTQVESSTLTLNSPLLNVGISTKDNGSLMKVDCIVFYVSTDFAIFSKDGKKLFTFTGGKDKLWKIVYRTKLKCFGIVSPEYQKEYRVTSPEIVIKPLEENATIYVQEFRWFKKPILHNREYRGVLLIRSLGERIVVINRIKLDEYLYSVVKREIGDNKPKEALKVQAVVARTLALYRKNKKIHKYFDVCNGQHCQVYDGVKSETLQTIEAVNSTLGEVIVFNNNLIHPFFHANCGGMTRIWTNFCSITSDDIVISDVCRDTNFGNEIDNIHLWYISPPKLFCESSVYVHPGLSRWFRIVQRRVLEDYLNKKYNIGKIKAIRITKRFSNGYIKELKIVGSKRSIVINKEHKIRNITPQGALRSASFFIEYNKNNDSFYFWGAGWGHGVGMCQSGTVNLASQGENYVNIIKHYYPNTDVIKSY